MQYTNSQHATIKPLYGPIAARTNPKIPPEKGNAEHISPIHKHKQKYPAPENSKLNSKE